jgi:hypothetical protein
VSVGGVVLGAGVLDAGADVLEAGGLGVGSGSCEHPTRASTPSDTTTIR